MPNKEKPKTKDLLHDAADWQPDDGEAAREAQAPTEPAEPVAPLNPEGGNDYVSFIENPYGIRTLEIADAQKSTEELELDSGETNEGQEEEEGKSAPDAEPTESRSGRPEENEPLGLDDLKLETDTTPLDNLAKAMAVEVEKLEEQARQAQQETEEDRAKELAKQIAEDQAIAEQMAREQAAADQAIEADPELVAALPKEPQPDAEGKLDLSELQSCIETLLFMMDKPASTKKLKELLGSHFTAPKSPAADRDEDRDGDGETEAQAREKRDAYLENLFTRALEGLQARYASPAHGIELTQVAGGWQLRTKPGRAALAKKLARTQIQRLSSGGMETLAIVAYRQPVLKDEIDKIRGVDSSYFVRGLLDRKLIAISGRSELPGRPMLYSTTETFLELFGLKDLSALPSLREIEQMVPQSQSKNPEDEDPRVREMRRLVATMKSDTSTTLLYDPKEDEKILTEIRERVKAIPSSTPYLDEQKAQEKAAAEAAKEAAARLARGETAEPGTQLDLNAQEQNPEALDVPPPESIDEPEPSANQV